MADLLADLLADMSLSAPRFLLGEYDRLRVCFAPLILAEAVFLDVVNAEGPLTSDFEVRVTAIYHAPGACCGQR